MPVRLHPLFLLVMFTAVLTGYFLEMIILFAVVLIHELGHVAAAKSFGWRIKEIQLLPFGGAAVADEYANTHPIETIVVSLAGPLQHVWLILFSHFMMALELWTAHWGTYFIQVNLMIGMFNFIPIHPLDGGKILQALLSLILPYYRSLTITAWLGFAISSAMVTYCAIRSFQGDVPLNLFVISLFLLFSNWYLWRQSSYHFIRFLLYRMQAELKNKPVTPLIVSGKEKIHRVLQRYKQQEQHIIYVTGPIGEIRAVMPETKLIEAYFSKSKSGRAVSDFFV